MFKDESTNPEVQGMKSRRMFIGGSAAAMLGLPVLAPFLYADASSDEDNIPETPEQALKFLYEGNQRFVKGESQNMHRDMKRVQQVATKQQPYAAFLGCADSRVPIEIVFDQGFGDLFVTRIAGNIATSENIGSLEFGTLILKSKVLYVLGHTGCGAVTAALKAEEVPGQISGLFQHIRPAIKASEGDLERAVIENVKNQALMIAESSPVIAKLVRHQELLVAGGVYNLESGKVTPVEIPVI